MNRKWSTSHLGLPCWRVLRRYAIALACPALIIWLGSDAISHITEMYDGLCPVTGRGFAELRYDDDPLAYCVGIGSDLSLLSAIVLVAAAAVPGALGGYWYYADCQARKKSG
jgi:hypothetical protein